ncbi:MAG: YceD family protein [Pseudorhodobacter sp.]|nr:YceD family protein [Pseudorhodobacter sp.]
MPVTPPPLAPLSQPYRTKALSARKPTRFDLAPGSDALALVAALLGLTAVRALRFKGELRPTGHHDFELEAQLAATVEQPCGITLAPVVTIIREPVLRRYTAAMATPDDAEIEMPEDDSAEPLPEVIDVGEVALEALALALPLYPRAPGAELPEMVAAPPGVTPLRDADLRPFAGLTDRLRAPDQGGGGGGTDGTG